MNMEGSHKKISVVVPNYNYSNYIEERLDSIINQTYPIYELIILDDCSTDDSQSVIESYLSKHPDLNAKFIPNKKNTGSPFKQWSKGFMEAKGDYVWIAEADDISAPSFLAETIKSFEDPSVVLSYCESNRIDENGNITSASCRDWMLAASTTHWNNDYCISGEEEIKAGLSIMNTIPNVSAVVFRQSKDIPHLLEEAGKFTLSGDWYFYVKLLETGKIAYHSQSLNFFRKHTGSVSTDIKKTIEVDEALDIQRIVRNNWILTSEEIFRQSFRYESLLAQLAEKDKKRLEKKTAKKIAWIVPTPIKGSGGIRTIINNASFLVKKGYQVDLYIEEDFESTPETMYKKITQYYGECLCRIFIGISLRQQYDLVFATFSLQTDYILHLNAPRKAYFIQDFEPWFEPMGDLFLQMENTYRLDLEGICIGRWLAHKINSEFGMNMHYFNFCADLSTYKPLNSVKKENAVCFIFQPEKPRRCHQIGLSALRIVKKMRPDVNIYLYGSNYKLPDIPDNMHNLKIIPPEKCNELYNKCKVGLCLSSSNPSRIPFEMMASGLPVVDIYRENNVYDMPDSSISLAEPTPEALATAILEILDNPKKQAKMSKSGIEFMTKYPIDKGYDQFEKIVNALINDEELSKIPSPQKTYQLDPVKPSADVMKVALKTTVPTPVPIAPTSRLTKKIVKSKRAINKKYKNLMRKVFKI